MLTREQWSDLAKFAGWDAMRRGQMKNQTVPVPAEVLIAILSRLTPDGRFEVRHRGVEPEILEDLYYQAKELLRDKEGFGQI